MFHAVDKIKKRMVGTKLPLEKKKRNLSWLSIHGFRNKSKNPVYVIFHVVQQIIFFMLFVNEYGGNDGSL